MSAATIVMPSGREVDLAEDRRDLTAGERRTFTLSGRPYHWRHEGPTHRRRLRAGIDPETQAEIDALLAERASHADPSPVAP